MSTATRLLLVDRDRPGLAALEEAASILRGGGLVAFATETVYGLGANATDPRAVRRIFEAKGRPSGNPLIVHADGPEMARACVSEWPARAEALAAAFWPGPLTLVLPRSGLIPDEVTAGRPTVGVRVPSATVARALITRAGIPVAAPSANRSTGISPTLASHVQKDLDGRVDLILDSGPADVGLESTVLDLTSPAPRILRPGPITREAIQTVLGEQVNGPAADLPEGPFLSPGQMLLHYTPRTPTVRVPREEIARFDWPPRAACLVFGEAGLPIPGGASSLLHLTDPEEAAARLYAALHSFDDGDFDLIVLVPPPSGPEWSAILDRINRASAPRVGTGDGPRADQSKRGRWS